MDDKGLSSMLLRIAKLCLLLCIIHLSGCAFTKRHQDGPPDFNVDISQIPDAVPQKEALSRYGNKANYSVFGKKYSVLKSSQYFEEQGVASWYGSKFHNRKTSSGETYNMLAMTAAHKSLPLPTYVQVTNLQNGKKIIVKVNDRGPFESNRIIDLSYVAAKKLDMLGRGTALVDIKALSPDVPLTHVDPIFAKKSEAPVNLAENFSHHPVTTANPAVYLQVGYFKNHANAKLLQKKLTTMLTSPVNIYQANQFYRVQVGPIRNSVQEAKLAKRLHTIGIKSKRITSTTYM